MHIRLPCTRHPISIIINIKSHVSGLETPQPKIKFSSTPILHGWDFFCDPPKSAYKIVHISVHLQIHTENGSGASNRFYDVASSHASPLKPLSQRKPSLYKKENLFKT